MIFWYNVLFLLGGALGLPFFVVKALTVEKRRATVGKRFGVGLRGVKLTDRPVWIHALSVGEVLSSTALIKKMKETYHNYSLVFSVSTLSGYELARRYFAYETDCIFFFPYDFIWTVRRFLRCIDPCVFLLIETDIWPNFLNELKRCGVPAVLVNGRISPRSHLLYKRVPYFSRQLMSNFASCCMQTEVDARRIISVGAPEDRVEVTGNLKFDMPPVSASDEEINKLRASMGIRPEAKVFVAGSTHEGEEDIILRCFESLKSTFQDLVLVVVPRDPGRANRVCRMFQKAGFVSFLRTEFDKSDSSLMPEAVIVDTIGELRRVYAMANLVFVGKSLVNLGGQNPIEPAALGKPILFGPHMFNFELVADMLIKHGGALQVTNGERLSEHVKALLSDPKRCSAMGKEAYRVFQMNRGAVAKTIRIVERFL